MVQDVNATLPKKNPGRKRFLGFLALTVLLAATAVLGISSYVGWNLTHPLRQALDSNPEAVGLSYQEVSFPSREDRLQIKGWFIKAPGSSKTVIFAHGYRKNRLQNDVPLLPIAKFMIGKGYNVLMFDFRNSGESEGRLTSVGQYEIRDLLGAVDYVLQLPGQRQVLLYGFSMGASTAIVAAAREPAVGAVIADSPFADLKAYLNENLSIWSGLPTIPFNQAFFLSVPLLTGVDPSSVSPVREIASLNRRPLLLIHGEADLDVPIRNSEMLCQAYPAARLLRVAGGAHVKNYQAGPAGYLQALEDFLDQNQSLYGSGEAGGG